MILIKVLSIVLILFGISSLILFLKKDFIKNAYKTKNNKKDIPKKIVTKEDEQLSEDKISDVFTNKLSILLMFLLFAIFLSVLLFIYFKIN